MRGSGVSRDENGRNPTILILEEAEDSTKEEKMKHLELQMENQQGALGRGKPSTAPNTAERSSRVLLSLQFCYPNLSECVAVFVRSFP